jgi:hypothetical protein
MAKQEYHEYQDQENEYFIGVTSNVIISNGVPCGPSIPCGAPCGSGSPTGARNAVLKTKGTRRIFKDKWNQK